MNNEPVAIRYDFDGYGYQYMDSGSGSDWQTRVIGEPLYTHPMRELTDEEINKLWAESHEDGIAMQQGFTTQQHYFAHLILKKAQEK